MSNAPDITQPGPAGLFRFVSDLTETGWQQEHSARSRLEHWCQFCGQRAHYAYGETLSREGVWSCSESDCRAAAEAEADARSKLLVPATHEVSTDLFGRAA